MLILLRAYYKTGKCQPIKLFDFSMKWFTRYDSLIKVGPMYTYSAYNTARICVLLDMEYGLWVF